MTVYVDSESKIRAVGTTSDETLAPLEVTDGTFEGWTPAKICCYKVQVSDGQVTMMTPYIDSRLIDTIDMLGRQDMQRQSDIDYIAMEAGIELDQE